MMERATFFLVTLPETHIALHPYPYVIKLTFLKYLYKCICMFIYGAGNLFHDQMYK